MQENFSILSISHICDFYQALTKKEKGKLLKYLEERYGYNRITISAKLRVDAPNQLKEHEVKNIASAIEKEELWMY